MLLMLWRYPAVSEPVFWVVAGLPRVLLPAVVCAPFSGPASHLRPRRLRALREMFVSRATARIHRAAQLLCELDLLPSVLGYVPPDWCRVRGRPNHEDETAVPRHWTWRSDVRRTLRKQNRGARPGTSAYRLSDELHVWVGDREPDHQRRAPSGPRFHGDAAPRRAARVRRCCAAPGRCPAALARDEPDAVVGDAQLDALARVAISCTRIVRALRMTDGVGQRFLRDAEQAERDVGTERVEMRPRR